MRALDRLWCGVFADSYSTSGADFAEEIEPADPREGYEPGDVLVIGQDRNRTVARAGRPYETTVIGIYSTQPGVIASPYPTDDPRRAGKLPVAMIGIVTVQGQHGEWSDRARESPGDLLDARPCHERHRPRAYDGGDRWKALEPFAAGSGTILVAVTLQ